MVLGLVFVHVRQLAEAMGHQNCLLSPSVLQAFMRGEQLETQPILRFEEGGLRGNLDHLRRQVLLRRVCERTICAAYFDSMATAVPQAVWMLAQCHVAAVALCPLSPSRPPRSPPSRSFAAHWRPASSAAP